MHKSVIIRISVTTENGGRIYKSLSYVDIESILDKHRIGKHPDCAPISIVEWVYPSESMMHERRLQEIILCPLFGTNKSEKLIHIFGNLRKIRRTMRGVRDRHILVPVCPRGIASFFFQIGSNQFMDLEEKELIDRILQRILFDEIQSFLDIGDLLYILSLRNSWCWRNL